MAVFVCASLIYTLSKSTLFRVWFVVVCCEENENWVGIVSFDYSSGEFFDYLTDIYTFFGEEYNLWGIFEELTSRSS
jgi:hypothetical protein